MSIFRLHPTPINGLHVLERSAISDSRGFFERIFCQEAIEIFLKGKTIQQINRTLTRREGTVRGLHFQHPPDAEVKIVTCLHGRVWDVVVDLRRNSPTFLQHHAILLTEDKCRSFLIPEGCAHGFQTMEPNSELLYLHTANYNAEAEGALNATDPALAIKWPKPITERSLRDSTHPMISDTYHGIEV